MESRGREHVFRGNFVSGKMLCASAKKVHFNRFGVQDVWLDVGKRLCWEDGGCACCFVVLETVWLVGSRGDGRLEDFDARPDREVWDGPFETDGGRVFCESHVDQADGGVERLQVQGRGSDFKCVATEVGVPSFGRLGYSSSTLIQCCGGVHHRR